MAEPYVGEIRMFGGSYAPVGWVLCQGQPLPIAEYETLYSLIGTTYGGDGVSSFNVPDLRGRVPLHMGTGPGLSTRPIGQMSGSESVALVNTQIPSHTHAVFATAADASGINPTGALSAVVTDPDASPYVATMNTAATLGGASVAGTGGNQPHENLMPSLCVNFIIATDGIYPTHP